MNRSVKVFFCALSFLVSLSIPLASFAQNAPPPDAFKVLQDAKPGPRITPFLQYQLDEAWRQDEAQQKVWDSIHTEADLLKLQNEMRASLLEAKGNITIVAHEGDVVIRGGPNVKINCD